MAQSMTRQENEARIVATENEAKWRLAADPQLDCRVGDRVRIVLIVPIVLVFGCIVGDGDGACQEFG